MLDLLKNAINSEQYFVVGLFAALFLFLSIPTALHAILHKRSPRSAALWLSFIILSPGLGAIAYYIFGINRMKRRVEKLKLANLSPEGQFGNIPLPISQTVQSVLAGRKGQIKLGNKIGFSPLCTSNSITPLINGDRAYPEMLKAIREAKTSITLLTYIFDKDEVGEDFISALGEAANRGVQIRVLIDDVGNGLIWSKVTRRLNKLGVQAEDFLPISFIKTRFANLRNHRKLTIIDGRLAFTGGLNISQRYWPGRSKEEAILDLHFKIEGDLVPYLQTVFSNDWLFTTGEELKGEPWFISQKANPDCECACRVVSSGPEEKAERMKWLFIGAINAANESIRILTPYFLPDQDIISALCAASLRGIEVDILVPKKSDQSFMKWATQGSLRSLLKMGCKIWYGPPPFDHSKLLIIDQDLASFGSSNWDARSLRLNFELNIEVYDTEFAKEMNILFKDKLEKASLYTLEHFEKRPLFIKIRDGLARLFSPYL